MEQEKFYSLYNTVARANISDKEKQLIINAMIEDVESGIQDEFVESNNDNTQEREKILLTKMNCLFATSKIQNSVVEESRDRIYSVLINHNQGDNVNKRLMDWVAKSVNEKQEGFDQVLFEKVLGREGNAKIITQYIKNVPITDAGVIVTELLARNEAQSTKSDDATQPSASSLEA